jgi:hypothetical protein
MTTADVLDDAGIDWDAALPDEEVKTDEPGAQKTGQSRGTRSTGGARRGRRPVKRLENLQSRLSKEMFQAGTMIGFGVPVTGLYICQESDAFTKAVVELAGHRPEWIEALEHIADIQPGIVVGRTIVGVGAAIAVDRKRIDPEQNQFIRFLGVYSAYKRLKDKIPEGEEGNAYRPPPASFSPISLQTNT